VISVEGLCLTQGAFRLDGVRLAIPTGAYGVLMGSTGSGKTTILEAIAGLRPIRSGTIRLGGIDATDLPPEKRNLGYVPQDGALFRRRTVAGNLSFALELRREPAPVVAERVAEMASWLGIAHLLKRMPGGLSGGEAQRVALGRALIFDPPVLLLDEPLAALDDDTRGQLIDILRAVRSRRPVTVLHITHNRAEAESLADVRLRLRDGAIVEE
jgi:ABC-type sugar transport system ATPase subunit